MKKGLQIILVVIIAFLMTACAENNNKEKGNVDKIEILDQKKGLQTTFTNLKELGFSEITTYQNKENPSIEFDSINLDCDFTMSYLEIEEETYTRTKESRSQKKYYKEYTFNHLESYLYGDYENNITIVVLLQNNKSDKTVSLLIITMNRLDDDKKIVLADKVEEKEVQNFFNSIEFKRIEKKEEIEE